jgi:hypothetical protein
MEAVEFDIMQRSVCLEGVVARGSSSLQLLKAIGHSLIICRFQDIAWQPRFLERPQPTKDEWVTISIGVSSCSAQLDTRQLIGGGT